MVQITGRLRKKYGGTIEDFNIDDEVLRKIQKNRQDGIAWLFIKEVKPFVSLEIYNRYSMLYVPDK